MRVGIKPTNKGFADPFPSSSKRYTVDKKQHFSDSALRLTAHMPGDVLDVGAKSPGAKHEQFIVESVTEKLERTLRGRGRAMFPPQDSHQVEWSVRFVLNQTV